MALTLSVPASTQALPRGTETKPKAAKAWIESLPLTKTRDSGHALLNHIVSLNRSKFPAEERMALLEIYRPVIATLLDEFEHVYAQSTLPLTARQRETFDLARSLAAECAIAYKHFLVDKTSKFIAFGAKKSLPLPLHRALSYTGMVLIQSFKTYYPAPDGTWRDLHQLYSFAEEQDLLAETPDAEAKSSVADVYCEAVLLAIADPYRLMSREAEKVLQLLSQTRGVVTLTAQRPDNLDPMKEFIVALDSDRAPRLMALAIKDPPGQVLRMLNLAALIEKFSARLDALAANKETANNKAAYELYDLLTRLLRLWGDPPKRQFRRNPTEMGVALCAGIKAIAYFSGLALQEDRGAEAAAIESGDTMPLLQIPNDSAAKVMGVEEWTVLNQSPNGLRLHHEPGGSVGVTVGEAIGVRFSGGQGWSIGVVRWLNVLDNDDVEFGVELIAPSAIPMELEQTISTNSKVQPALKLPTTMLEGESETLLTFPDTFSDLREFELNDGTTVSLIRATGLVEKTSRFEIFQFSPS